MLRASQDVSGLIWVQTGALSLAHVCSHLGLTRQTHVPPPLQPPREAISHADMVMVSFEPIGCQMRVNASANQPLAIKGRHATPLDTSTELSAQKKVSRDVWLKSCWRRKSVTQGGKSTPA